MNLPVITHSRDRDRKVSVFMFTLLHGKSILTNKCSMPIILMNGNSENDRESKRPYVLYRVPCSIPGSPLPTHYSFGLSGLYTNMRSIMHFYMPSFHALLEQLRKPGLAGKPVVVVHKSGRGELVVSASPEAEAHGVRESMTSRHAGRYCPNAVFLPADWYVYRKASDAVLDILSDYSPLLEPQGLNGAYMDVTGCFSLFGSPASIASEAQRRVMERTHLPISVGIAANKLVSRAASHAAKLGCLTVEHGRECEYLHPLPVSYLPGVGPKIAKRLFALGIKTIGDLAKIPERLLVRQFGVFGSRLHKLSFGIDYSPVLPLYPPARIRIEHVFDYEDDDLREPEVVLTYLRRACDQLSTTLRERNEQAGVVSLAMEFEGDIAILRSYTFKSPVSSAHEIYSGVARMLSSAMCGRRVKAMEITLSALRSGAGVQLSFDGDAGRRMRLDSVLESIRARFGEKAIACGVPVW